MAASPSPFFAILLSFTSVVALAAADEHDDADDFAHLHFYVHERVLGAPNATVVLAVDPSMTSDDSRSFGSIVVFDNAVRIGLDPSSKLIGRAQAMGVFSDLSGTGGVLSTFNLVFTAGEYNGSSLAVTGFYKVGRSSERSIVGGSRRFRLARGYILIKLVNSTETTQTGELDAYIERK